MTGGPSDGESSFRYCWHILCITDKLQIGWYESMFSGGFSPLRDGEIQVFLSIVGYFSDMIMLVSRCVICGIINGVNFLIIFMLMISLPTE